MYQVVKLCEKCFLMMVCLEARYIVCKEMEEHFELCWWEVYFEWENKRLFFIYLNIRSMWNGPDPLFVWLANFSFLLTISFIIITLLIIWHLNNNFLFHFMSPLSLSFFLVVHKRAYLVTSSSSWSSFFSSFCRHHPQASSHTCYLSHSCVPTFFLTFPLSPILFI